MPFQKGHKIRLGMKTSEETKQKMSLAGKKRVEEGRGNFNPPRDNKHWRWKGDKVQYGALHTWVRRRLGKPNYCAYCESTTAKKYEWCNISKTYRRELSDWVRLCTSCHRLYDYGKITL